MRPVLKGECYTSLSVSSLVAFIWVFNNSHGKENADLQQTIRHLGNSNEISAVHSQENVKSEILMHTSAAEASHFVPSTEDCYATWRSLLNQDPGVQRQSPNLRNWAATISTKWKWMISLVISRILITICGKKVNTMLSKKFKNPNVCSQNNVFQENLNINLIKCYLL